MITDPRIGFADNIIKTRECLAKSVFILKLFYVCFFSSLEIWKGVSSKCALSMIKNMLSCDMCSFDTHITQCWDGEGGHNPD